jgi:hypothetical protein
MLFVAQHEKFQSAPGSRVGTPAYLAPEVILTTRGKTYDGKVSQQREGIGYQRLVLQQPTLGGAPSLCCGQQQPALEGAVSRAHAPATVRTGRAASWCGWS